MPKISAMKKSSNKTNTSGTFTHTRVSQLEDTPRFIWAHADC